MSTEHIDPTLREQIGQLLVVGFPGTKITPEIVTLIQEYKVSGIVLFSRNIGSAAQVLELTQGLQKLAREAGHRYPLLISIDQENGMVQRLGDQVTLFPGNMALGATGDTGLAEQAAQAAGEEILKLGINLNLAPVVDVNNNPANPVIGIRSFGEDAEQVARFGAAAVRGYRAAGVITCLKHFPGHGDTSTDSHLALPTIPHSLERLTELELVPFRAGIEAGADTVMTAHITFPALTPESSLPATTSPTILRQLLREQLGFEGVVISDCLEMDAISQTIGVGPASVLALQAGVDLILISHLYERQLAGLKAIEEAVATGQLAPEIITRAAKRVTQLKAQRLSWEKLPTVAGLSELCSPAHRQQSQEIYERSTTLVRNGEGRLPLHLEPTQRLVVVFPLRKNFTRVEDRAYPHDVLVANLRQRHPNLVALPLQLRDGASNAAEVMAGIQPADLVIVTTVNALLDKEQQELVQQLKERGQALIGIAAFNPYDLLAFPELETYLVTYEYTAPAIEAAVRVLFGELKPQGHLPVSLPGLYQRGHGLSL